MKKKPEHYVDNKELFEELKAFKAAKDAVSEDDQFPNGQYMIRTLTDMLMKMVAGVALHQRWRRYTDSYIEEMKGDAYLRLVQVVDKFKPDKSSNPFGYFTQVIWRTFRGRVDTENDLHDFIQDEMVRNSEDFDISWSRQAQKDIDRYGDECHKTGYKKPEKQ